MCSDVQEVASGRVLQRSASAGSAGYKAARTYVVPALSRTYKSSRFVIDPAYEYTSKSAKTASRAVNKHLEHPRYKMVMDKARHGNKLARQYASMAGKRAKGVYEHSMVRFECCSVVNHSEVRSASCRADEKEDCPDRCTIGISGCI